MKPPQTNARLPPETPSKSPGLQEPEMLLRVIRVAEILIRAHAKTPTTTANMSLLERDAMENYTQKYGNDDSL